MPRRDLVPVRRRVTVPATHAQHAVQQYAGDRPLIGVAEDPTAPYRPGDRVVSVIVTTLEPPARRVQWHWILAGVAAVIVAGAIAYAVVTNLALLVAGSLFATLIVCALYEAKSGGKS